ncbi:MAG: cyclophilin-like fold protein [Clostridia bacterium]|nr:cyclophilin-like fold protein [Clostridia bacterium]
MKKLLTLLLMFALLFNAANVNAEEFVYGDADGNGVLTASDAALILQKVLISSYSIPIENMLENYMSIIDVDGDGVLTSSDCAMVLQKVLDNGYTMPCESESTTIIATTEVTTVTTTEFTTEATTETTTEALKIEISVGGKAFNATLYDNDTSRAFFAQLPLTLNMSELNGNEKYFYMDNSYPTNSQNVDRINMGDLMLYGNDCLVLFYDSFNTSYRYTPLGKIDNTDGLADALGRGNVSVTFRK